MPDLDSATREAVAAYQEAVAAYRALYGPDPSQPITQTEDSAMPDTVTAQTEQPPDESPRFTADDLTVCCGMFALLPMRIHVGVGEWQGIDEAVAYVNRYADRYARYRDQYDDDGYDMHGYDAHGRDRDGYDEDGYDADGLDRDGLDSDGYDADGEYHGARRRDALVHEWDYTPFDGWSLRGQGRVFMGAEIEVESRGASLTDGAALATECLSCPDNGPEYYGVIKHDGSLSSGFEIATQPMTYEWSRDRFPWHMLTQLREMGFRSTTNCGLHVHVNRDAFDSAQHTYRWLKFVYRNPHAIQALGRRGSVGYAQWDEYARSAVKDHAKGDRNAERYLAVNVTNDETFEVRLFRSSLRPQAVQAAFGFVEASLEYTRGLTVRGVVQGQGWGWGAFVEYVEGQGDRWAPLLAEIAERNIDANTPQSVVPADNATYSFRDQERRRRDQAFRDVYGYLPDSFDRRTYAYTSIR